MATFGIKKKAVLLPDAVLTIMPQKRAHSPDEDENHRPTTSITSGQTPKCPRSAYKKRERKRKSDACDSKVKTATTGCQTSVRPKRKSARTQYNGPRKVDRGLQFLFKLQIRSCGTETNNPDSTDEPQQTTVTVEEFDTSLTSDSSEMVVNLSDSLDSSYTPTSSRNSSWQSSFNEDQGQKSNHQERKFLVAESVLLSLFNFSVKCGNEAQGHINHRMGTFINIIQKCDFCCHKRSWNSKPFVGSIPVGNLQLSAAILFAGAIPTQALRIFEFLKMTHINKRYFLYAPKVLPPARNYTVLDAKAREATLKK